MYLRRCSIYDFGIHEILPLNVVDEIMNLSDGSMMLLRLAYNLYNGFDDGKLTPRDVFYVMNKRDFIVAKGGIDMRFDMDIENQIKGNLKTHAIIEVYNS